MPVIDLTQYLDARGVKYVTITHSIAYTAQEIAALAHVRGKELAKTVVIKVDGKLALAVLPASEKVDLERLRDAVGAQDIRLASEAEFRNTFTGCELGAMPPFGNLYGMETYASPDLGGRHDIVFNAGTHVELIRMAYEDFERLVNPKVVEFAGR
jgi:Ala-tRNA(Pro) deacylase